MEYAHFLYTGSIRRVQRMTHFGFTWQSPDAIRALLSLDPPQKNPESAALPVDIFGVQYTGREHGRFCVGAPGQPRTVFSLL
jgi:hypothetical protein